LLKKSAFAMPFLLDRSIYILRNLFVSFTHAYEVETKRRALKLDFVMKALKVPAKRC